MEEINFLLGYENLKIVQNTQMFRFSLDSILLPNFVTINKGVKRILDIGCGNCPIPLVLSTKTRANIDAIEIQKESYLLGKKTIELNNLTNQINIINADVKEWYRDIETDTYDVIVCNPPFFTTNNTNNLNDSINKTISRHDKNLNINDLLLITKKLLKNNGTFAIVHRPEKLVDILIAMRNNNIEPKRIQYVYPKANKEANTILIEGRKNGNTGLKLLDPLYVHNYDGSYKEELKKYFE